MGNKKIYPFAVACIRSMENKLVSTQKLMQMAEAKTADEALRVLSDTAYGKYQIANVHDFERAIKLHMEETYSQVAGVIPSEPFIDIFLFKNDYHNIKVLIKEEMSKESGEEYLLAGGTIPLDKLRKNFRERNYVELTNINGDAIERAISAYAKTKMAGYIDSILDRACFESMMLAAKKLENDYVVKYVRILADTTNLKTFLRVKKTGRDLEVLRECLVPGGELSEELFVTAYRNESYSSIFKATAYGNLCEQYMDSGFTVFEKACDDYLMGYVKDAKYKSLTPEPVVGYIFAKETESKCIRIIMTCKIHNIDVDIIKERVREAYV